MNNKEKLREFSKRLLLNIASQALPNSVQMAIEIAKDIHELWLSGRTQDLEALVEGAQALSVDEREALVQELTANQPEAEPVARGMLETLRAGPTRGTITATLNHTLMRGTGQTLRPSRLSEGQRRVGAAVLSSMMLPAPNTGYERHKPKWPEVPGYRLERFLGVGAFAEVYAARTSQDQRGEQDAIALKIGLLHDPGRFKREVAALRSVEHPNLMDYLGSGVLENPPPPRFWIAMPALSGLTLRDLMNQGLDDEQKLLLAVQILEGLVALHDANQSHRDLKPENALIGDDFQLKLTDFGLSKAETSNGNTSLFATQSGEMLGTPAYMSPEQAEGRQNVGKSADVWAFGVLLYELFVGHLPFDGPTLAVIFGEILHRPLDFKKITFPKPLLPMLERCIERNLDVRYADAPALAVDFRPAAAALLKEWRHERFRGHWTAVFEGRLIQAFAGAHHGVLPAHPVEAFLAAYPNLPELDHARLAEALPVVFRAQVELEGVLAQQRTLDAVDWSAAKIGAKAQGLVREMQAAVKAAQDAVDEALRGALRREQAIKEEAERARAEARAQQAIKEEAERARAEARAQQAIKEEAERARARRRKRLLKTSVVIAAVVTATLYWNLRHKELPNPCGGSAICKEPEPKEPEPGPANIAWIAITGGSFEMGSDKGSDNEKPVHTVRVRDFWIGKTEVTVKQYRACVAVGACSAPDTGNYCNWGQSGREDHPINCVDWDQAKAFATWAGGRLPSEAEWEYAARSQGQGREYPWGDAQATCDYAVMDDGGDGCGQDRTWPVCSKPRGNTEQGVCDMSGNVWEWVADYYGSYSSTPRDGTEHLSGSRRVMRGGSWDLGADRARAANRRNWLPSIRNYDLGFRLVRTPR